MPQTSTMEKIPDLQKCVDAVLSGSGAADAAGVSPQQIEQRYRYAYHLYAAEEYARAYPLLEALILLRPGDPRFSLAAAACCQQLGRYQAAVVFYGAVASHPGSDLMCMVHAAECLLALGQKPAATECLQLALMHSEGDAAAQAARERAQSMLALLSAVSTDDH